MMKKLYSIAPLPALLLGLWLLPANTVDLFYDDFSRLPPGWLSTPVGGLNGAIQEYHYLPHRGVPLGPWENAICHLDAWVVGDEDGQPYLEQHSVNSQYFKLMNPIFLTGDPEWSDYAVEAKVKPLCPERNGGPCLSLSHQSPLLPLRSRWRKQALAWQCACRWKRRSAWPNGANSAPPIFLMTPRSTTAEGRERRIRGSRHTSMAERFWKPATAR